MQPPPRPTKPARRQVDSPVQHSVGNDGDYNIWYHKQSWGRENGNYNKRRVKSQTKCNVVLDTGYTRANTTEVPWICVHFARGCCFAGEECSYLHRIPTRFDQARLDITHDIFGRERHREDRADMGGVGCMNRENKTIYVNFGGASSYGYEAVRGMIAKTFGQFGTIEELSVKMDKTIAFVTYDIRASAEFAKECAAGQSLLGSGANEILDVRWSYDDANPRAVARRKRKAEEDLARAVQQKIEATAQDQGEEDDIDRYLDDDPYYDLPVSEDENEQDQDQSQGQGQDQGDAGTASERKADPVAEANPKTQESEEAPAANPLGLIAGYSSSDEDE